MDINAKQSYDSITEALKQVYNPNLNEGVIDDSKKAVSNLKRDIINAGISTKDSLTRFKVGDKVRPTTGVLIHYYKEYDKEFD